MTSLDKIKEVRARSGVGLDACRSALDESGGDADAAIELLKRKGMIRAADRAGRLATEGKVFTYVHGGGSKVAVVEINCETDFAAKSDVFLEFGTQVAMHIVASQPVFLHQNDVSETDRSHNRLIFLEQIPSDKSEVAREKIIEGKFKKFFSETCLMDQESAIHQGKTIEQLRVELGAKLGENITIRRFIRWEVGEGLTDQKSATGL